MRNNTLTHFSMTSRRQRVISTIGLHSCIVMLYEIFLKAVSEKKQTTSLLPLLAHFRVFRWRTTRFQTNGDAGTDYNELEFRNVALRYAKFADSHTACVNSCGGLPSAGLENEGRGISLLLRGDIVGMRLIRGEDERQSRSS